MQCLDRDDSVIYCPICEKMLVATNADDVESGISDGYVFVHTDIIHSDSDIEALGNLIN